MAQLSLHVLLDIQLDQVFACRLRFTAVTIGRYQTSWTISSKESATELVVTPWGDDLWPGRKEYVWRDVQLPSFVDPDSIAR